jgi:hypothetical protein
MEFCLWAYRAAAVSLPRRMNRCGAPLHSTAISKHFSVPTYSSARIRIPNPVSSQKMLRFEIDRLLIVEDVERFIAVDEIDASDVELGPVA